MVGSACWRLLTKNGFTKLIGKTRQELDLTNQQEVDLFLKDEQPEIVIDAAAKVGGILANATYPYEFLMNNLQIQNNLISGSLKHNVKKFVFLGSSCIYPKFASQPIKEESLLTSDLEHTNQWYAIAKIAGLKSCEAIKKQYGKDFFSLMPTNLYGPNDNFDLKTSHVLPALIRKLHEAKVESKDVVELWGTGEPLREFLHVDDLAEAVIFSIHNASDEVFFNVGSGHEISIKELAELIKQVVGFDGEIFWNREMPDGTPRKLMDSSRLNALGWKPKIELTDGIQATYDFYLESIK